MKRRPLLSCGLVLLALIGAAIALERNPARADQGKTIAYTVGSTLSVDELTALAPDPVYHEALRTQPLECSLLPECRLFLLDLAYPAKADPATPYFISVTATLHGSAQYELQLFADPLGNSAEVSSDTGSGGGNVLHTHLLKHVDDPIQEYGITMFMTGGAVTDFTLSFSTSTIPPVTPFESLNPNAVPTTIPPPIVTEAPTTAAPPPETTPPTTAAPTPPPPQAAPDSAVSNVLNDTSDFNAALAAPTPIFKKTAAVTPPGKPSTVELWLGLLALPLALLALFPFFIRRSRRGRI